MEISSRGTPSHNHLVSCLCANGKACQLSELSTQVLQEIAVTQVSPVGISYTEYLTARCFDYDLLILSPDWCPEGIGQAVFSGIPPALLDSFPSSGVYTEVVEKSDLPYAFVLPETSPFYSFSSDKGRPCLLFPSPESVNLDGKNEKGNLGDDAALQAMRYLLGVNP